MNLIDRYVTEVGKYLPRRSRADIEAELRSTLEDMLEDRSQQAKSPVDDAMVEELLSEYGAPKKVAESYGQTQYLIGPRLYPSFTLVLKIVLAAVTLGLTIATIVSLVRSDMTSPEVMATLGRYVLDLLSGLIQAFGNVVLIFAILERALPASEFETKEAKWTPAELTREPHPNEVKVGEMIAGIVFTMAFLLILNFYPQIIGIWSMTDGIWYQIAGLSDAFFRYLPFINLSGLLTIVLDIYLLRKTIWTTTTRWLYIGIELIGIAIANAMLNGPALLEYLPTSADADFTAVMTQVFDKMIPVVLVLVIVFSSIEIIKTFISLVRPNSSIVTFTKK